MRSSNDVSCKRHAAKVMGGTRGMLAKTTAAEETARTEAARRT
jgi:hypothetical protein